MCEGRCNAPSTTRSTAAVFLDQNSSPLPTRMSPVHASRVTTTRLVPHRRRLLGATLAAGVPSPQRSSAIMCEDNSRSHSSCVWVDCPCEEQARGLLECTADRPVRETHVNFENIVRVVQLPPQRVAGRVALSVESSQLSRIRPRVNDPRARYNSRSPPIGSRKRCRPISRSYVQCCDRPALQR